MSEELIPFDLGVTEPPGGFKNVFPRNPQILAYDAAPPPEEPAEPWVPMRGIVPRDLTAEPEAYVLLTPGWAERLKELTPRVRPPMCRCSLTPIEPDYCNVCENFPCLGGHPPID